MRNVLRSAATTVAVLVLSAQLCAADTIYVPKGQATIQAAVTAAAPGDTIVVARGLYVENVVVPTGKDGLVLRGLGATMDGNLNGVQGVCLTVGSANVAVTGFTFRNGTDQIFGTAAGLSVSKCTFLDARGSALEVTGDGMSVDRCRFDGVSDLAVQVTGASAALRRSTFRRCGNGGLDASGLATVAELNTFVRVDDSSAIRINGDGCKVAKNRFSLCDKDCIRITGITSVVELNRADRISARLANVTGGDNAIVRNNRASLVVGGINVDGDNAQVLSNRVSDSGATAAISVTGDNLAVSQNLVNQTWNDADGISVDSRTSVGGGTVQGNRVTDTAGVGMRLDSVTNLIVASNRVVSSTEDNRAAFRLTGSANTVTGCVVTDADNVGFLIEGDTNSLTDCTVTGASEVGFLINGGTGNALTDCRASDCGLEGLDNQGFLTKLTRGRYRGARYDITNDVLNLATFTDPSLAGVNFETGGSTQQSQF